MRPICACIRTRMLAGLALPLCAVAATAAWNPAPLAAATGAIQGAAQPAGPGEIRVELDEIDVYRVTTQGKVTLDSYPVQETCQQQSTHTDASFTGGSYVAQAGFSTDGILAATYQLTPQEFPIRVDTISAIFVTSGATVQTVTEWSVLVWDGTPTNGTLVAEFSSDDLLLPHLRVGPGTQGVDLQVQVDPTDPEPIFVFNTSGTAQFTVGFRIDQHNAPSSNPCLIPPNQFLNAFPTTDVGGLAQPNRNWLRAINCGPFGCPPNGGWTTFGGLSTLCRPSGDWVIRAFWQRADCQPGVGACCYADGTCATALDTDCIVAGGTYQGDGVRCDEVNCPVPTGACCNPSGGCLNLSEADCGAFGGSWQGANTDCADGCDPDCPADLSSPASPGTPDGVLTGADFFEFLTRFDNGDLSIDFGSPANPAVPDGVLTGADFFRFLTLFAAGC